MWKFCIARRRLRCSESDTEGRRKHANLLLRARDLAGPAHRLRRRDSRAIELLQSGDTVATLCPAFAQFKGPALGHSSRLGHLSHPLQKRIQEPPIECGSEARLGQMAADLPRIERSGEACGPIRIQRIESEQRGVYLSLH